MKRVAFAYIVQINLPGLPIKVGQSCNLISRTDSYSAGTPCDIRLIGATTGGRQRELEFLEATKSRILKGEWRTVTPELRAIVEDLYARGEWYIRAADCDAVWRREGLYERLTTTFPRYTIRKARGRKMECHHIKQFVASLAETEPLLGLHIMGFERATEPPSFEWPRRLKAAA